MAESERWYCRCHGCRMVSFCECACVGPLCRLCDRCAEHCTCEEDGTVKEAPA